MIVKKRSIRKKNGYFTEYLKNGIYKYGKRKSTVLSQRQMVSSNIRLFIDLLIFNKTTFRCSLCEN